MNCPHLIRVVFRVLIDQASLAGQGQPYIRSKTTRNWRWISADTWAMPAILRKHLPPAKH